MGVLSNFENRLATAVESTFGRVFRSKVRPVEIARRLTKEIERSRSFSISKTYVPNSFTVYLSQRDYSQLEPYEQELTQELVSYILEYVRRENLTLTKTPVVKLTVDDALKLGEFGLSSMQTEDLSNSQSSRSAVSQGHTEIHSRASRLKPAMSPKVQESSVCLQGPHGLLPLTTDQIVIGRSTEADLVIEDPGISRKHAKLSSSAQGWLVEDLGSTNGVSVNGTPIKKPTRVALGDSIELSKVVLRLVERSAYSTTDGDLELS